MSSNDKYGKPLGNLMEFKSNFFEQNEAMLKMADDMGDVLRKQPKRTGCKICGGKLGTPLFTSHDIGYILCERCGHLNSEYEDTEEFANKVYIEDDYLKNYSETDKEAYKKRLQTIYIPKAEYLKECLSKEKAEWKVLDIGAGSGYFVQAAKSLGLRAEGIEISPTQVSFANQMAGEEILKCVSSDKISDYIRSTDAQVLSAIGVFEHIITLKDTLRAIQENPSIQYIYLSVPMFSFSCAFETSHQLCYNRHTGGTHTHLFSQQSLQYMADSMDFMIDSQWKFGSDAMDLYRFLCVSLEQSGNKEFKDYFSKKFLPLIDDIQLIFDQSDFASEVHMLMKRK
ncbi:MAG: methyltransferase domain-containing protein [Clostridia bacterium]|nr:methyltransferase domain-containing protein [Clostridia bacterium]